MVVTRGVGPTALEKLQSLEVGGVFVDYGFTSTTIRTAPPMGTTKVSVRVPSGVHAAPINGLSDHPSEQELLLPRGTKFRRLPGEGLQFEVVK